MTYLRTVLSVISLTFAANAHALQIVDPVEGHNSFIKISTNETTRLAIEGGKIRTVLATDGEISAEKDDERGQLFIRPLILNKPINIRVISSSGATYNLIMQAVDIPQEDVVLREPFAAKVERGVSQVSHQGQGKKSAGGQAKYIRDLVATMALEDPPVSASVRKTEEEFALWEGTRFVLMSIYSDRGFVGEKYELTNTGKSSIRLVEQELYRKGVLAVAIENMQLNPGQTTNIYVVRAN